MKASSKIVNKDYSLINCSQIQIKAYEFYDLQKQIKKVKYPTYPISNAEDLQLKIQSFRDDNVRTLLRKQLTGLNSYRKVRGDGNCFFRALAFYSISLAPDPDINSSFPQIKNICLTCCNPASIPNEFKKFYEHKFLFKILERQWQLLYSKYQKQCDKNSRKALIKMFDEYPFLDFIAILYFRAVCLKALWKQQNNLKQFLIGKQEESIRTYSEQTEGVVINICSMMLNLVINVYQIRKGIIKTYHYDDVYKKQGQIHLLFNQNHYDIIQKNQQIQAQKDSLSKTNYYSDVSKKKVKGVCLQCDRQKLVYEDSAICQFCFDRIQQAAKRYDGQKLKRGRCQDCMYFREDILEDLGICKKCMKIQNQVQEKRKKQQERRSKMKKCIECNHLEQIQSQTGMCAYCLKRQQKWMGQMQAYQEKKKSDERMRQNSPVKQRDSKFQDKQKLNSDYFQRSKLKQAASPSKQMKIGIQIKPSTDDYKLKQSQPAQRDKIQNNNMSASTKPKAQIYNKCLKCQKISYLFLNSSLCRGCYDIIFSYLGTCFYCTQKKFLNPKYKACVDCYSNNKHLQSNKNNNNKNLQSNKNNNNQTLEICEKCNQQAQLQQNTKMCKHCYRKVFYEYTKCISCGYYGKLHSQYTKCKDCMAKQPKTKPINQINQRGNSAIKKKCMKCNFNLATNQSLCQSCFKSHFCIGCKNVKLGSPFISNKCYQCRRR